MTRWLAVGASLTTIGAVSLVLGGGMTGRAGTSSFEIAVLVMNIATPLSSLLLTWHLRSDGRRAAALIGSSPLFLMALVGGLVLAGSAPSLKMLLWLDAYVLIAHVVLLGWVGRALLSGPGENRAGSESRII